MLNQNNQPQVLEPVHLTKNMDTKPTIPQQPRLEEVKQRSLLEENEEDYESEEEEEDDREDITHCVHRLPFKG